MSSGNSEFNDYVACPGCNSFYYCECDCDIMDGSGNCECIKEQLWEKSFDVAKHHYDCPANKKGVTACTCV